MSGSIGSGSAGDRHTLWANVSVATLTAAGSIAVLLAALVYAWVNVWQADPGSAALLQMEGHQRPLVVVFALTACAATVSWIVWARSATRGERVGRGSLSLVPAMSVLLVAAGVLRLAQVGIEQLDRPETVAATGLLVVASWLCLAGGACLAVVTTYRYQRSLGTISQRRAGIAPSPGGETERASAPRFCPRCGAGRGMGQTYCTMCALRF